jgi:hypothetical protein
MLILIVSSRREASLRVFRGCPAEAASRIRDFGYVCATLAKSTKTT